MPKKTGSITITDVTSNTEPYEYVSIRLYDGSMLPFVEVQMSHEDFGRAIMNRFTAMQYSGPIKEKAERNEKP